MIVISSFFWFLLAILFACVEIEAEGKYGWAQKMPTWYRTRGIIPKIFCLANAGKPLTGYHTFMFFIPLMIFHSSFVMGVEWNIAKEIMCVALYFLWCPVWDYLWFVLNPAYGWSSFKKSMVWWHAKDIWILWLPLSYFAAWSISAGLAVGAAKVANNDQIVIDHLIMMSIFLALTILVIPFSPLYHCWYNSMRQRDDSVDRAEAGIFHRGESNVAEK